MTRSGAIRIRPVLILLCIGGMASAVWIVGERVRNHRVEDALTLYAGGLPLEHVQQRYSTARNPVVFSTAPAVNPSSDVVQRDLKTYYGRRAYAGAPPTIPHEVDAEMSLSQDCNACHEKGGFAPGFTAYTPLTPHPEFVNCTQCHVPQGSDELFRETTWASVGAPRLNRPALPGGPPPIPHTMQMRDQCLACHAGPAVPLEIRTPHPERVNCVQCHVPTSGNGLFTRTELARREASE